MPQINTDGLLGISTNNATWVAPSETFPVTLANQQRGGVMVITGAAGDQLLDINGRLLQDGSIVFNQARYEESPGVFRAANTYFRYQSGAARQADGTVPNVAANWAVLETGGGGGGGAATAVDDIAALNALAAATPEPANGTLIMVLDPREADDANPAIQNLPAGIDWDAADTEDLNLIVAWDADADDWNFVQIQPDNQLAFFVNRTGDTMTGPLTMENQNGIVLREATGNGTDAITHQALANLNDTSTTYSWPNAPAEDRVLQSDAAGTLSWVEAGGGGGGAVIVGQLADNTNADGTTAAAQGTFLYDDDTNRFFICVTTAPPAGGGAAVNVFVQLVP